MFTYCITISLTITIYLLRNFKSLNFRSVCSSWKCASKLFCLEKSVSKHENNTWTYEHEIYKTDSYRHSMFLTTKVRGGHKNVQRTSQTYTLNNIPPNNTAPNILHFSMSSCSIMHCYKFVRVTKLCACYSNKLCAFLWLLCYWLGFQFWNDDIDRQNCESYRAKTNLPYPSVIP